MVKIWEVDFTSFSGATNTALDNIGDQHLTSHTGIQKISTVAGFSFRPGLTWGAGGAANYYDLVAGSNERASWNSNYNPTQKRSFVMWFYSRGIVPEDGATLWGSADDGSLTAENGFITGPSSTYDEDLYYAYNNGSDVSIAENLFLSTGWHCAVATIDRTNGEQRVYVDNSLAFWTNNFSDLPSTSNFKSRLGDFDSSREISMQLGYVATYDHILYPPEVAEIYERFMFDSAAGETPLHVISGFVYDLNNNPAVGNRVYLIRESSNYIEYYTTTNGAGYYEVPISYSGNYTLIGTNSPNLGAGGRAQPLLATAGGITFL